MIKFEKVKRFADSEIDLIPKRGTQEAAGYDLIVAEETVIPSMRYLIDELSHASYGYANPLTLNEVANLTAAATPKARPTLVSTGVKCYLDPGYYLELSVRSSTPLKHWLILANSVGIIDGDYVDNETNEGEIFLQLINLGPAPIVLKPGDKVGQGIIKKYYTTDNDGLQEKATRKGGFGSTNNETINVRNQISNKDLQSLLEQFKQQPVVVSPNIMYSNVQNPTEIYDIMREDLKQEYLKDMNDNA